MFTRSRLTLFVFIVVLANTAVFAVEYFVFTPLKVPTNSMSPILRAGDRVAVNHTVGLDDLERGDLVVFAVSGNSEKTVRPGSGGSTMLVKRVIALPGETIEAHRGYVTVDADDRFLPESYLLGNRGDTEVPRTTLGEDELWVLGDNRNRSVDSRRFGPVEESAIVGRVAFRFWPLNRFHRF